MTEDKKIEEMALEMASEARTCIVKVECAHCGHYITNSCKLVNYAKRFAKLNYRMASDVAREIFEDCHNTLIKILGVVRDGLDKAIREDNEEAKLVHIGTEETVKCIILIFAELKKKYTEGGE